MNGGKAVRLLPYYAVILSTVLSYSMVLADGQTHGYEASLYTAYPQYFWWLVFASYASIIFVLMLHVLGISDRRHVSIGAAGLVLENSLLYLLPFFRGYSYLMTYGSPNLGLIEYIVQTAHFLPGLAGDPTPASHIVLATSSEVLGISVQSLSLWVPAFYFSLYTLMLWVVGKALFRSTRAAALLLALLGIPIYSTVFDVPSLAYYIPRNFWFAALLPGALLLLYRAVIDSQKRRHIIALLIFLSIAPFYHPFDALLLLGIMFTFYVSAKVYGSVRRVTSDVQYKTWARATPLSFTLLMVGGFVLWAWFSRTVWFQIYLTQLNSFENSVSGLAYLSSASKILGFSFIEDLKIILARTGDQLSLDALGLTISIVKLFGFAKKRFTLKLKDRSELILWLSYPAYLVFFLVAAVSTFSPLSGIFGGGEDRVELYLVLFSGIVVASWSIGGLVCNRRRLSYTAIIVAILTIALMGAVYMGVNSTYGAPSTLWMNMQVTSMDTGGITWFTKFEIPFYTVQYTYMSLQDMIVAQTGNFSNLNNVPGNGDPPPHFCYNSTSEYGSCVSGHVYFITNSLSLLWEPVVYRNHSQGWLWGPQDYGRLENDSTVSLVYNNGDLETYFIKPS